MVLLKLFLVLFPLPSIQVVVVSIIHAVSVMVHVIRTFRWRPTTTLTNKIIASGSVGISSVIQSFKYASSASP